MAWTNPFTWVAGQTVTDTQLNTHIRDNLNFLKDGVDHLAGFAFSTGQSNAGGGGDTQLTSYDVTIPADYLNEPGDLLIVEGTFVKAATAETSTVKLKVGSGTARTIISTGGTSDIVPFRIVLRRRTSTTGSVTGIAWVGAAAAGAPTNYLANADLGTVAWTASQTLAIFAASTTAAEMLLTDYSVQVQRGNGATV